MWLIYRHSTFESVKLTDSPTLASTKLSSNSPCAHQNCQRPDPAESTDLSSQHHTEQDHLTISLPTIKAPNLTYLSTNSKKAAKKHQSDTTKDSWSAQLAQTPEKWQTSPLEVPQQAEPTLHRIDKQQELSQDLKLADYRQRRLQGLPSKKQQTDKGFTPHSHKSSS